ncbi:MAG TPA: flavin reductase family protein [Candidatus Thermoplasmatota archaeon]|nr:flavin reductase family protein [Candidatus Thermoplasmatota archaeon]
MDEAAKKQALRMLPYGLHIGGAAQGPSVHAFLLSWFSQASFKPPLVMAGLREGTKAHAMVLASRVFSVNLLARTQKEVAASFLHPAVVEGGTINGHGYTRGHATGCLILDDAPAWLECRVVHDFAYGDHTVLVAEVVEAGVRRVVPALTEQDTGWSYGG